jgi:hypothetical protein
VTTGRPLATTTNQLKEIVIVDKNILSKEHYNLKLSEKDSRNLAKFCIISASIYDTVSTVLSQLKSIEPYVKEWQELEKPISGIIRRIKSDSVGIDH